LEAVGALSIRDLDSELNLYAPAQGVSALAARGLRGELAFAVPSVLHWRPQLLGYYRLLLGYSQKSFYTASTGFNKLKSAEESGRLSTTQHTFLPEACSVLNHNCALLIETIPRPILSAGLFDDLTLLTLGPQLRGGANNKRGVDGINLIFDLIHHILASHVTEQSDRSLKLINASRRQVAVEFAADPDIVIREQVSQSGHKFRNIIAIEIKAGTDYSNIHNRIGEAEKSHQKARKAGFTECWTVVNVPSLNLAMARTESPSTNRFFTLYELLVPGHEKAEEFADLLRSLTGIPNNMT
jgi:hypothetical protein